MSKICLKYLKNYNNNIFIICLKYIKNTIIVKNMLKYAKYYNKFNNKNYH